MKIILNPEKLMVDKTLIETSNLKEVVNKYMFDIYELAKTRNHKKMAIGGFWDDLNINSRYINNASVETELFIITFRIPSSQSDVLYASERTYFMEAEIILKEK